MNPGSFVDDAGPVAVTRILTSPILSQRATLNRSTVGPRIECADDIADKPALLVVPGSRASGFAKHR
jgi:hypothetical protein